MPAALPLSVRSAIVERRQQGHTFRQIAVDLHLPYASVRQVWQHWQTRGTLQPQYAACGPRGIRKPQAVYTAALALKRQHPRWGAVLIRLHLAEQFPHDPLPAERTLQTWFRQAGLQRLRIATQPRAVVARGRLVHAIWAVDAKEQLKLADGSAASWLTVSDEASGAILEAVAFPPRSLESGRSATGAPVPATGV